MLGSLFLLRDRAQHVARARDVREINLRLDFVFGVRGRTGRSGSGCCCLSTGRTKTFAHQFCFVLFQRTRMRFLLGNPNLAEHIKNGFALDLKLASQIIDSNLH